MVIISRGLPVQMSVHVFAQGGSIIPHPSDKTNFVLELLGGQSVMTAASNNPFSVGSPAWVRRSPGGDLPAIMDTRSANNVYMRVGLDEHAGGNGKECLLGCLGDVPGKKDSQETSRQAVTNPGSILLLAGR